MNTCYRCGDQYQSYSVKSKRYGVLTNGIIFGVGYENQMGRKFYRRMEQYINLCPTCLKELENFIEIFNDSRKKERKHGNS